MALDPKQFKKDLAELNKLYKELKRESKGVNDFSQGAKGAEQMAIYLREAKAEVAELNTTFSDTVDFINNIGKEFNKGFNNPLKEGTKSFKTLRGLASDLEDDMLGIVDLEKKQLLNIQKKAKQERVVHDRIIQQLKDKKKLSAEEQSLLANLESEVDVTKIILDQTEKRLEQEEKIAKTAGITGAIFNSLSKTLGKIGIGSEFFEDGKKNIREAAKSGSKLKVVGAGISSIFSGIGQALGDPVVMFGLITKAFTALLALGQKFSKYTADIGKSFLGMAAGSEKVAKNLKEISTGANGVFLNFEEARKALIGINAVAGTAIDVSEEQVLNYQKYSHFLGLSEEATQGLLKTATLAGGSFENIGAEITGVVAGLNQSNDLSLNINDILEDVANASAKSRANIGQNPEALAKAAFQAKRLGMTLDQVASAAENTLDFESSIQNEMEAELLLGKNLNLEQLRYASLTGDTETAAKEMNRILKENIDSTEGNVIKQKALAKSLGVSVEEMHEMNQTRLLQNKLSKFGDDDRVKAEKEVNRLMAKGMSQEEALQEIAEKGLEATIKKGETAEASQRILEEAKETLQTSLAPLAAKIAKAIATIASSDSFKSFLKTMGDVMGWIAKHPKLVMAAVGLKMISSLIPKPVYLVGKGGKMLSGMSNMFSKGGGTGTKALSKASAKGLSSKQIAAGFGGKAAKDQLEKQRGKKARKGDGKLGAKTLGKSILKKIPGVGLLAGVGFGLQRAMKGDFLGAAMELGSGALSLIPGVGTAASVGLDGLLAARDVSRFGAGKGTAADFISRPGMPIQKFRADDVVIGGTNPLGGGGGSNEVASLLRELISAVKEGGDVFMDGNKVGKSLALATSNMG